MMYASTIRKSLESDYYTNKYFYGIFSQNQLPSLPPRKYSIVNTADEESG